MCLKTHSFNNQTRKRYINEGKISQSIRIHRHDSFLGSSVEAARKLLGLINIYSKVVVLLVSSSLSHENKMEEKVNVPEKKNKAGPCKLAVQPQRLKGPNKGCGGQAMGPRCWNVCYCQTQWTWNFTIWPPRLLWGVAFLITRRVPVGPLTWPWGILD